MFEIGQIFIGSYPAEAARFCNQHNLRMVELPPTVDGSWRFQIQEREPEQVTPALLIAKAQAFLDSTDWYAVRYAETGVEIPEEVRVKRAEARAEISRLRGETA